MGRARIALLSNPKSTGNVAQLPRVRAYCAEHPDIFHYEVERVEQIGEALKTIARVKPAMLIINGGDGTVQAALTELHNGGHFGHSPPPVAVLPSGKTNLIALDLGSHGDSIAAFERLVELAQGDLTPHLVARELIALRHGDGSGKPVIGMFLGGAGLADTMLYCRNKIYPLGLPNGVSHVLAALDGATGDDHLRTLSGEGRRDHLSDALGRTGHDRNLAVESHLASTRAARRGLYRRSPRQPVATTRHRRSPR